MMSTRSAGRGASARATIPTTAPVGSTRTPGRRSPCRNAGTTPAGHIRSTRGLRGIGPGSRSRVTPPERANRGTPTPNPPKKKKKKKKNKKKTKKHNKTTQQTNHTNKQTKKTTTTTTNQTTHTKHHQH